MHRIFYGGFVVKTTLIASIFLGILLFSTGAMSDRYSYPAVYPFVPADKAKIYGDVKTVTEDPDFIYNFQELLKSLGHHPIGLLQKELSQIHMKILFLAII